MESTKNTDRATRMETINMLIDAINGLLGCTDLSLDELDDSSMEAIRFASNALVNAERLKNQRVRVVVHYHDGLLNAVYASDPEAVKVTVIDTDDDDDEDRKERDGRLLDAAERLPDYYEHWRVKRQERRAA